VGFSLVLNRKNWAHPDALTILSNTGSHANGRMAATEKIGATPKPIQEEPKAVGNGQEFKTYITMEFLTF
jgi:hypothetical protein